MFPPFYLEKKRLEHNSDWHVAIVGIDIVVFDWKSLIVFLKLLAHPITGQKFSTDILPKKSICLDDVGIKRAARLDGLRMPIYICDELVNLCKREIVYSGIAKGTLNYQYL